jgi:hypothetical protein
MVFFLKTSGSAKTLINSNIIRLNTLQLAMKQADFVGYVTFCTYAYYGPNEMCVSTYFGNFKAIKASC